MNNNLRLVINNSQSKVEEKQFFEKYELQIILDLYAKMVSEGSWKDYGLSISSKQVSFSVFKNVAENALYKICKNFRPKTKNLKYLIIDCLWYNFHPSHFNLEKSLFFIKKFEPKNAILTNLSPVLDYNELKKKLPKNVVPAHDGLTINL